jgi:hypothetical protein
MSDAPTSYNRPERKILGPDQLDDLGHALLALTREVVIMADRVRVLEAVLDSKGIEVHAAVERHEPDADLQKDLDERGKAIVKAVIDALRGV